MAKFNITTSYGVAWQAEGKDQVLRYSQEDNNGSKIYRYIKYNPQTQIGTIYETKTGGDCEIGKIGREELPYKDQLPLSKSIKCLAIFGGAIAGTCAIPVPILGTLVGAAVGFAGTTKVIRSNISHRITYFLKTLCHKLTGGRLPSKEPQSPKDIACEKLETKHKEIAAAQQNREKAQEQSKSLEQSSRELYDENQKSYKKYTDTLTAESELRTKLLKERLVAQNQVPQPSGSLPTYNKRDGLSLP